MDYGAVKYLHFKDRELEESQRGKEMVELLRRVKRKSRSAFDRGMANLPNSKETNFVKGSSRGQRFAKNDSQVPQAKIVEVELEAFDFKDWREHFSSKLSGDGLEIGPLHRPLQKHNSMNVQYIDRYSVADLRSHYPELNDLPLVEPDILGDASTLEGVQSEQFDFVVSAHVIEHMPNPIAAIENWLRVTRTGGLLYLIVPDKRVIFDKNRMRTTLEHLILDYQQPSKKRDFEHFLDYAIHVHEKTGKAAIEEAQKLFDEDYSIHFHVFVPTDVKNLLQWISENVCPLKVIEGPCMAPKSDEFHFLIEKA